MLYIIVVVLGMLVPIQTAANARMRMQVQSVWVVTLLSFSVSTLALLGACAAGGVPLLPMGEQLQAAPWWSWSGGLIALLSITAYICLFRELGTLQATILPIVGQLVFGLVIDHYGFFRAEQIELTPLRILAAALLLGGTALAVAQPRAQGKQAGAPRRAWRTLALQLLGIGTGCLLASMGAIYGALGRALGSAVQAALFSFTSATGAILLCCTAAGVVGLVRRAFAEPLPWWKWLGGVIGAMAVFGNAWIIPQMGAGAFFMLLTIGQIVLSLCMEQQGWLGAAKRRITYTQLAGLGVMLAGVALLRLC